MITNSSKFLYFYFIIVSLEEKKALESKCMACFAIWDGQSHLKTLKKKHLQRSAIFSKVAGVTKHSSSGVSYFAKCG